MSSMDLSNSCVFFRTAALALAFYMIDEEDERCFGAPWA